MKREFNTGTIIVDNGDKIYSVNHFISHIIKQNSEELIGKHLSDIFDFNNGKLINRDNSKTKVFFDSSKININGEKYTLYIIWRDIFDINSHPVFGSIINSSLDPILVVDASDISTDLNKQNLDKRGDIYEVPRVIFASRSIKDLNIRRINIEDSNFLNFVGSDHIIMIRESLRDVKINNTSVTKDFVWLGNNNTNFYVECKISPVTDSLGNVNMFSIVIRKIQDGPDTLETKIEERQHLESLFNNNPDLVFSLDKDLCFSKVNNSFLQTTGFSLEELTGKPLTTIFHIDHFKHLTRLLLSIKNERRSSKTILRETENLGIVIDGIELKDDEFVIYTSDRDKIIIHLTLSPVILEEGSSGVYGIAKIISHTKKLQKKYKDLAYLDGLTGLPNRSKFQSEITKYRFSDDSELGKLDPDLDVIALVFFDLDNFKGVNDTFGHTSGDKLLEGVANRIKGNLGNNCLLSRISGDEFTVIITDFEDTNEVKRIVSGIKHSFVEPFDIGNEQDVIISSSIGVAMHPRDAGNAEDLIKFSDAAMYTSKNKGKNYYMFYEKGMVQKNNVNFNANGNLREAIKNGEFILHYQPILDSVTKETFAAEALVRWQKPTGELIFPGDFIHLAEASGAIESLGIWVIDEACRQINEWEDSGYEVKPISVNVSGRQLERVHFFESAKLIINNRNTDPSNIIIEVTESIALDGDRVVIGNLKKLKEFGCKLAIDDFGAGHSSLTYLKDFPFHYLKMDNTFTKGISNDNKLMKIVTTIVNLGHLLDLEVVAEGVETLEESKLLESIKTDLLQGYYYSRPIMPTPFRDTFLKKRD